MKKIAILLIALILISVSFLSGCNEVSSLEDDNFIGIWKPVWDKR